MTAVDRAAPEPQAAAQPEVAEIRYAGWAVRSALVLAPWGFVIANASYAWMIRNGGNDETGSPEHWPWPQAGPDHPSARDRCRHGRMPADHSGSADSVPCGAGGLGWPSSADP